MKTATLNVERRELKGKGYNRQLRQSGMVPGVLYGKGGESTPIQVRGSELGQIINTSAGMNALINVTVAGDTRPQMAMVKELTRDLFHSSVLTSVDLLRVSLQDKLEVSVPLTVVGEAVDDNGLALLQLREVLVLSVPTEIPDSLSVDISGLKIGDTLTVGSLTMPTGVEAITPLDEVVLSIQAPRVQEEVAETETGDTETQ